jgi:phage-related protein
MSDEEVEARQQLGEACINLLVTIGLVASVMERFPIEVQQNFTTKINEFRETVQEVTNEFVEFGGAYDDHIDRG